MPYRYLDDGATYDAGFHASASTLEELLAACWSAALGIMIDDETSIRTSDRRRIEVVDGDLDLLLFDLLGELLYFKDADHALYRLAELTVDKPSTDGAGGAELYRLRAVIEGESIDPTRHELGVDVKAVTLDRLRVWREEKTYHARVVVDT